MNTPENNLTTPACAQYEWVRAESIPVAGIKRIILAPEGASLILNHIYRMVDMHARDIHHVCTSNADGSFSNDITMNVDRRYWTELYSMLTEALNIKRFFIILTDNNGKRYLFGFEDQPLTFSCEDSNSGPEAGPMLQIKFSGITEYPPTLLV